MSDGELLELARTFFATHGQSVECQDGRLEIGLEGPLAAHFGVERLTLVERPEDERGELFAPGSRAFDRMADWLAGRGRAAAFRLPARTWPAPEPRALDGRLEPLPFADEPRRWAVYDFLLAFLTDERAERLWSVALDPRGKPDPAALALVDDALDDPAPGLEPAGTRHLAEAEARAEAERLAKGFEAEAAGRLARTAARLQAYYDALIAEVPLRRKRGQPVEAELAAFEAERAALRADMQRRLAEEARRHQLRVQVRLLGQASLELPGRRWAWRLAGRDGGGRLVEAWQDLASGVVEWPGCERCGRRGEAWGLCGEGHLACAACMAACSGCGAPSCRAELVACGVCGAATCARCLGSCASGHAVCRTHLVSCACCGLTRCDACPVHEPLSFS